VSGLNACTYCYGTHVGVAEACGVAPDLIRALLINIETAPLEARMKPILRHARKLTLSPARVTEADAAAVYEVGWGDDALYSTVLVTALFNFYNRLGEGVWLVDKPVDPQANSLSRSRPFATLTINAFNWRRIANTRERPRKACPKGFAAFGDNHRRREPCEAACAGHFPQVRSALWRRPPHICHIQPSVRHG
jgi:AhpD family alkylhydroperoxidase